MIHIGIDPGLDGAVAILNGESVQLFDSPAFKTETRKKRKPKKNDDPLPDDEKYFMAIRRDYDIKGMVEILAPYAMPGQSMAALESVHSMPEQGVASAFKFGCGLGIWQGILGALRIRYEMVPPQRWKKALMDGMGKNKDASMIVAQQLFPNANIVLRKHHGRADALLLAEYLRRLPR